ncbi:uncharacterized protein LOC111892736 [Lactuca sativa]|uniref:uncharacterized protein LOC111892736 n=1 Tax=Lactuca sativa TaxID=4236 RepID=UPI000CD9D66F|nr:uncharacterized protein LOC111892736 [Lactuca sativa]
MASILKGGRLTLALIILIVISSSSHIITTTATARTPYNHERQLATNCDYDPIQQNDGPDGCGSGSGSGSGGSPKPKPIPCGSMPGRSLCRKGCCGKTKMGRAECC